VTPWEELEKQYLTPAVDVVSPDNALLKLVRRMKERETHERAVADAVPPFARSQFNPK
jgi:hypothetical protein